jgi:hypothetical protein
MSTQPDITSDPAVAERIVQLFMQSTPKEELESDPAQAISTFAFAEAQTVESFLKQELASGRLH